MKFIEGHAISHIDGERRPAKVATCDGCYGDTFRVFLIDGRHQHLECTGCGVTFCDGSCGMETMPLADELPASKAEEQPGEESWRLDE